MANIESDATYCSEVEKENLSQIRRSKRLSQKFHHSFRSNGDPASLRFDEIHQMLKSDTFCNNWSKYDWLALKYEIGSIKKSLKKVAKSKLTFVEKKINECLKKSNVTLTSNSLADVAVECPSDHNKDEPVKSPNILAGMMTEVLTELPPYQPQNLSNILTTDKNLNLLTQVSPLDLTKRNFNVSADVCIREESAQIESLIEANPNEKDENPRVSVTDTSKGSMIDLTTVDENQAPAINSASSKNKMHTSKWLKYLPSQHKPKTNSNEKPKAPSPLKDKPQSLKQSLANLYKANHITAKNVPSKTGNGSSTKVSGCRKSRVSSSKLQSNKNPKPNAFRCTDSVVERDFDLVSVPSRNVQSENVLSLSTDIFSNELIQPDLLAFNDDDSDTSLPFSLKENFKKVFGTDSLNDVLGCEKVIYSLTERHVERLASALNIKNDALKRTIEQILVNDNCALLEDDLRSGSSVVECSQSPPQRLFPSQRSQISK